MLNKEFENFKRLLSISNEINVFYHYDLDGLIAAVILYKSINNKIINFKPVTLNLNNYIKNSDFNVDLVIFLDLATSYTYIKNNVIIIDHHEIEEKYNNYINIINPKKYKVDICYPTSKILYDFFKNEDLLYLVLIGSISDSCIYENLLKKFEEKYKVSRKIMFNIVKYLESYIILKGRKGSEYLFNFLKNLDDFDDLKRKYHYFKGFYNKLLNKAKELEEYVDIIDNFVFLEVKEKIPAILSYMANYLQDKYKNKIIFVYTKKDDEFAFSSRSPKEINLLEVLDRVKKYVSVKFGGHKNALGGRVKDIEKLKLYIMKLLKNF